MAQSPGAAGVGAFSARVGTAHSEEATIFTQHCLQLFREHPPDFDMASVDYRLLYLLMHPEATAQVRQRREREQVEAAALPPGTRPLSPSPATHPSSTCETASSPSSAHTLPTPPPESSAGPSRSNAPPSQEHQSTAFEQVVGDDAVSREGNEDPLATRGAGQEVEAGERDTKDVQAGEMAPVYDPEFEWPSFLL